MNDEYVFYFKKERCMLQNRTYKSTYNYFETRNGETDIKLSINHLMRAVLLDWLISVFIEWNDINHETIYLLKRYLDEYIVLLNKDILPNKLQLLGCVCGWVASKFNDIFPPSLDDWVVIADDSFKDQEMLKLEVNVINTLKFNLYYVTEPTFLAIYIDILKMKCKQQDNDNNTNDLNDSKFHSVRQISHFFCDLTIIEVEFITYPASIIALSSIVLAIYHAGLPRHYSQDIIKEVQESTQISDIFDLELMQECCGKLKYLISQIDKMTLTNVKKKHAIALTIYNELIQNKRQNENDGNVY